MILHNMWVQYVILLYAIHINVSNHIKQYSKYTYIKDPYTFWPCNTVERNPTPLLSKGSWEVNHLGSGARLFSCYFGYTKRMVF